MNLILKNGALYTSVIGGVPMETLQLAQQQDTRIASLLTYILMAH